MTGVDPGDFDLVEMHDCFTIAEIVRIGTCRCGSGRSRGRPPRRLRERPVGWRSKRSVTPAIDPHPAKTLG